MKDKELFAEVEVQHAQGVVSTASIGGVQAVGARNVKNAHRILQKNRIEPIRKEIKDPKKFKLENEYKDKGPMIGDIFFISGGSSLEITGIGNVTPSGSVPVSYVSINSKGSRCSTYYHTPTNIRSNE